MAGVAPALLMRCLTMTLLPRRHTVRRKAVWGPKATLAAFLAVAMAFAPAAMAKDGTAPQRGQEGEAGRAECLRQASQIRRRSQTSDEGQVATSAIRRHRDPGPRGAAAAAVLAVRRSDEPLDDHQRSGARPAERPPEAVREAAGDLPRSLRPSDIQLQLPHVGHRRRHDGAAPRWATTAPASASR